MGLFAYALAGAGFLLVGIWESFFSSSSKTLTTKTTSSSSSSVTFIAVFVISFFFILNSSISLISAHNARDQIGTSLQFQVILISSLFFLYSVLGLLTTHFTNAFPSPSPLLNLLCLFAFGEEFLLFYLQRKDPSGIENRYFDLLLVPITVCLFSTILEFNTQKSKSSFPRLGRGIGLILQGTWFIQMGFSFYSSLMVHGCSLHKKSRGNYTVRCKGHPDYHRGRAIATLQFNLHLAFLVVLIVGLFSIFGKNNGENHRHGFSQYKPLGAEMQQIDGIPQFTLDSDDDDNENGNVAHQKSLVMVPEVGANGHATH